MELLILSHPHSDHLNGLIYIARHFHVQKLWTNNESIDSRGYRELMETVRAEGIVTVPYPAIPYEEVINGVKLKLLYPHAEYMVQKKYDSCRNTNNNSLVVFIEFGKTSFLFPGDIEACAEKQLIQTACISLKSPVLIAPHHGSRTSSTEAFLECVQPRIVIVSAGWYRRKWLPHPGVMRRYRNLGARIYQTAVHGAVTIVSDGRSLEEKTALGASPDE